MRQAASTVSTTRAVVRPATLDFSILPSLPSPLCYSVLSFCDVAFLRFCLFLVVAGRRWLCVRLTPVGALFSSYVNELIQTFSHLFSFATHSIMNSLIVTAFVAVVKHMCVMRAYAYFTLKYAV